MLMLTFPSRAPRLGLWFPQSIMILFLSQLAPSREGFAQVSPAARNLYQAHQDCLVVITAQVTVKFETKEGTLPDQKQTAQTLGTIIDRRGLVVLSNSAIDLSLGMVGQRGRAAGSDTFQEVTKATSIFDAIQVNLADSSVYHAARIDFRPELDLAFLLVDEGELQRRAEPLPALDLGKNTEGVSIGEQVIGLARASSVYAYIPTVVPLYISAISKRDPTYYITTVGAAQGMPVFSLAGNFVGLTVQKIVEGRPTSVLGVLEAKTVIQRTDLAKMKHKAFRSPESSSSSPASANQKTLEKGSAKTPEKSSAKSPEKPTPKK
jgi:hypothetical protein